MSKTGLRKIYAYSVTIAGTALAINRMTKLPKEDEWFGLAIFGAVLLFLFIPWVVFGASVEPGEKGLKVGQYTDVELDYREIYGCYRYVVPPFELAIIITRRRLPLRVLITANGSIGQPGKLIATVRSRIAQQTSEFH